MFFITIEHISPKTLITVMHVDILLLVIAIILKDDSHYNKAVILYLVFACQNAWKVPIF